MSDALGGTMSRDTDPKAAAIHRARAEKCYQDAERFRKLGLAQSEADARRFARQEDQMADLLMGVER